MRSESQRVRFILHFYGSGFGFCSVPGSGSSLVRKTGRGLQNWILKEVVHSSRKPTGILMFLLPPSAIARGCQATRKFEQIVYSSHTSPFPIKSLSHSFTDGRWRSTRSHQSVRLAPPLAFGAAVSRGGGGREVPFSFCGESVCPGSKLTNLHPVKKT